MQVKKAANFMTPAQRLLLNTCLTTDRTLATRYLAEWKACQDFNFLDSGSQRLIPLLAKQVSAMQLADPNLSFYKGIYRKNWVMNKQLFHRLLRVNDLLQSAGIPFLVLKGVGLSILYYQDSGLRPMEDVDILVPETSIVAVNDLLEREGWRTKLAIHRAMFTEDFGLYKHMVHSMDYINDEGFSIDVHWTPFLLSNSAGSDNGAWHTTQDFTINNVGFQTTGAEFTLLHTLLHAIPWNEVPSIRWIADTAHILKVTGTDFDWDRFIQLTADNKAAFLVSRGLEQVKQFGEVVIPGTALRKIESLPGNKEDLAEYLAKRRVSLWRYYSYFYFVLYVKIRKEIPEWAVLNAFSSYGKYVKLRFNLRSFRQFPALVAEKISERRKRKIALAQTLMKWQRAAERSGNEDQP